MVKVLSFLFALVLLVIFGYWLSINSGELILSILGYQIETSVMVGLVVVIIFMVTLCFVVSLLKKILSFPASIKTYFIERKITNLMEIQRQLIVEMASRNALKTKKLAAKLAKLTSDKALAEVCNLIVEKPDNKRDIEWLLAKSTTDEARAVFDIITLDKSIIERNWQAALPALERAWSKNKTTTVMTYVIEVYIQLGLWEDLEDFVDNNIGYMDRGQAAVIRTITGYNLAKELLNNGIVEQAMSDLVDLLKLEPNFHYSLPLLIETAVKHKIKGKVLSIVKSCFSKHQSPEITMAILKLSEIYSNDQLYDFALNLHRDNNESIESKIILAQFSLNVGMYDQAFREISHCLSIQGKTTRLCLLMAEFCQRTQGSGSEALDWIKSSILTTNTDVCPESIYLDLNTLTLVKDPGHNAIELLR